MLMTDVYGDGCKEKRVLAQVQKDTVSNPEAPEKQASHFCLRSLSFPTGTMIGSDEIISRAPAGSDVLVVHCSCRF